MTTIYEPVGVERAVDLFAADLLIDPYPTYAQVRATEYPYFIPPGAPDVRLPIFSSFADVQAVLREPRFGRAGFREGVMASFGDGPMTRSYALWMLFQDPPDHTRLRGLVSKAFTPRAVEILRNEIAGIVHQLLDKVRGEQTFDVMATLAYPLPVLVICELLGVPEQDRYRFGAWSRALGEGFDNLSHQDPDVLRRGNEAAAGLTEYFRDVTNARRSNPRDDLLSGLIAAEEHGDRLTEDELLATVVLLFFAGHETTVNLIGNGTLALLRNPDQADLLRAQPSLLPNAVEELLRYDSPVQRTGRTVISDVEIGGLNLHQGQRVNLLIGAANRDPRQFTDPDRLDVTRANAAQHLSFASGIHYCVGAPLARLEAQVAIGVLLQRYPNLGLATDRPRWRRTFVLRGLESLPLSAA